MRERSLHVTAPKRARILFTDPVIGDAQQHIHTPPSFASHCRAWPFLGIHGVLGTPMAALYGERVTVPKYVRDDSEIAYVGIADHLALRIAAGEFPPGAKLPSNKKLAQDYGANPETISRAAKLLVKRGLIKITIPKGKFVLREDERRKLAEQQPADGKDAASD